MGADNTLRVKIGKGTTSWGIHLSDMELHSKLHAVLTVEKTAGTRPESMGICDFIQQILVEYCEDRS